jgi:hypothetical protein
LLSICTIHSSIITFCYNYPQAATITPTTTTTTTTTTVVDGFSSTAPFCGP